jgi:predicted phage terminase large subunit-like protein
VDETGRVTKADVDEIRWRCQNDLKFLCKAIFGYKDWSESQRLHYDISRKLRSPSKFKMFLIPRDHLKSSIITKAGAVQRMLKNPDIRILIANNTWDNARKFLGSIQKYLKRGEKLSYYFGAFESEKWNQDEIVIKQRKQVLDAPTIATTGLEKEQTSQHYDLIIADDLVARENVQSREQRNKVKDYINSLMALLEPEGELWVVGTRWSQDDAYGDLIEEGIWDVMERGCYDPDSSEKKPIFPEKFSLEKLDFLRAKLGPVLFSCWYLNNPIAEESADFKKEQIHYYDPSTPHPSSLYMSVDPAMSLGADADYSGAVVGGMFSDRKIRIVDYFRKKLIPSDLISEIFTMVKKWNLKRVGIESFMFQKTLQYSIKDRMRETGTFFSVEELGRRHTGKGEPLLSKEARIRLMQPLFEQGLIEIRKDMTDFVDELLSFPRGKHDDLIDASAWLIEKLVPSAGVYKAHDDEYMTVGWFMKKVPEKQLSIYDRFMADLKQ